MLKISNLKIILIVFLLAFAISTPPSLSLAKAQEAKASYLYDLSNFTGRIPYNWAKFEMDYDRNETYVIHGDIVRIFNTSGMEVYRFGEDLGLGPISDLAVYSDGNILLLYNQMQSYELLLCDYRGRPVSKMKIEGLPQAFSSIVPNRIFFRQGRLYLVDLLSKRVVVSDSKGLFQEGYDLTALLKVEDKEGAEKDIVGFSVDREGNMFFTMPTLFKAFRLSPDKTLGAFGTPGSIPGKFNVVSGIASDDRGNIYVVDSLRCVVMIFDKDFEFLTEFSNRGLKPGELIAPKEVAVDIKGRVYVSQARRRGVSVFKIADN